MPETAPTIRRRVHPKVLPLALFLLACLQYIRTVSYDYAWDDKLVITGNDYTTRGIQALPDIFTKRVSIPYKSEYRPIPQALHAIEYQLFHGSPHAGHAFNVLWYALACVMVYIFVRFAFVRYDYRFALLVTLLFIVHPLHVEVVANIKSRDEILAMLFGLAAVVLSVRALEEHRWLLALAATLCFGVAFLSKSNAVTLLPIILLVAWYRSGDRKLTRTLVVASVVIAASCLALVVALRHIQSTVADDVPMHLNSSVLNNIFLWTAHSETIKPTAVVIIGRYLGLFLYPHPLIHLYGYDQIALSRWSDFLPWIVLAAMAAIVFLVVKTWKDKLPFAFGVLFFVITYSVYSNFFFYAPDTMADRFMFIPSIGLAIVAAYVVFRLGGISFTRVSIAAPRARLAAGIAILFIVILMIKSLAASRDWQNDSTLIENRIQYMENNASAQAIYGFMLNKESYELTSPEARQERQGAAMRAFMRAVNIYPDFQSAWIAIGKLFAERGIYDKAELAFFKAQSLEPLNPDGYFCLGTLYLAQQDADRATPYLEKAVLLNPRMEEAYVMLGKDYLQSNNIDNLGAMVKSAHGWFPENSDLTALYSIYLFRKQDYRGAFKLAREATSKDPHNTLALAVLSSPMVQPFQAHDR